MFPNLPRKCDVTGINARYLDCCLPDYLSGHYGAAEILAIPMHRGITYRDACESAKDTFHNCDPGFFDMANAGTMGENALHALFASLVAGSSHGDIDKPCDFAKYIEADDDTGEVQLYIGLYPETGTD